MPKFVPRQRKHKVLARSKGRTRGPVLEANSNAVEYIPAAKAEREEKKRLMRAEIEAQGPKVSGKKAKRLEKYLETKLRKDENRELIAKLAVAKVDTSLMRSSRQLGQGKETKREKLARAMREKRLGVDIDGDNEDVLFENRIVREVQEEENDEAGPENDGLDKRVPTMTISNTNSLIGTGLKRPLEQDEEGKPLLKKRKRRGGVKSKTPFKQQELESMNEPSWEGFSSDSDLKNGHKIPFESCDSQTEESREDENPEGSTPSLKEDETVETEERDETEGSEDSEENSMEDSESNDDGESKQSRSSTFKAWATQQINNAVGFQPGSTIQDAVQVQHFKNFKPRAREDNPLPLELQMTKNSARQAFSVSVERPPEIQDARLKLPVVAEEQKIMEAIHNNMIVVVCGATGSGKTTQVPQFLYEAGYGSPDSPTPGMIGVTQPRRVAAVSMAKRVGDELGEHGKRVAYQIRFEGNLSPQTAIKFMTDGILLREVAQDIALRKYSAIIIDEAHERSVNTDILIGMMSRVVNLREEMAQEDPSIKPLKLIIMSATLRVTDFTDNKTLFAVPPPVIQAEGRQYPVTNHFARKTHHDYVEEAFRKISRGHRKLPRGGFLVFLTGQNEITHLSKRLKDAYRCGATLSGPQVRISGQDAPVETEDIDFGELLDDGNDSDEESIDLNINNDDNDFAVDEAEAEAGPTKLHVLPLYSLLPTREQLRVFETPADGARLVVLATNVAETSLTIPGIRYVFDCGRSKERKYDQNTGVQSFEVSWISKASASQRSGRAGRAGPGHCYRLYSSAVYERDFQEFTEPEILRMPIEGVVLQLKAMNLQHVVNFPFPTPPNRQRLASSEKLLTYLSAISPLGQITTTGITMSIFPLSPRFARILLTGHLHDCLPYTIALVAGLSAADVFVHENQAVPIIPMKDDGFYLTNEGKTAQDAQSSARRAFNRVQKAFCSLDDKSDAIKLLQVVGEYAHDPTESWCQNHFVRQKVLKEILLLRKQITDLLRMNIPQFAGLIFQEQLERPSAKQVKALKQMVAAGFIDHVAIRADAAPTPPTGHRKPTRAIDVPYLTLFPSHDRQDEDDKAVYIHPSSPLAHVSPQECPEYIVYSYLQRATTSAATPDKIPRARMRALTDVTGGQLAALAKGTPLLSYGKPIKEVTPGSRGGELNVNVRECWVIPYLRSEKSGDLGWPLPARKVVQKKVAGMGWVVE